MKSSPLLVLALALLSCGRSVSEDPASPPVAPAIGESREGEGEGEGGEGEGSEGEGEGSEGEGEGGEGEAGEGEGGEGEGGEGEGEGEQAPVACTFGPGIELCASTADTCSLVFTGGEGCAGACAQAGLVCAESYEDLACGADESRPALQCADTGHGSDFCVCERPAGGVVAPPQMSGGCSAAALLSERAGFGANATGGDTENRYVVTTLSGGDGPGSLRRALESDERYWIVFDVDGTITYEDEIDVRSHKTIDGRGRDVTLRGTLQVQEERNIIISDVALMNDLTDQCGQAGDVIVLGGPGGDAPADFPTRDIWIHHVELHSGGDGLLDLRGATNVTVSWTHFHTHKKGLLMWKDADQNPVPGMRVTMHHNFFDRISYRGPQFLYGQLHYVNNYQKEWFYYGAGCLGDAQCASENNVFRPHAECLQCTDPNPCGDEEWFPDFKKAFVKEWASNGIGRIRSTGDLLLDEAVIDVNAPETVFDPADHYSFTAEPATEELAARIEAQAGPRTLLDCP